MRTRPLASAAVSLLLLATATAQNQPAAPAAPAAQPPAATVAGAVPTQPSVSRDKDTLSVDFPDEDIKTILRNVADLFELNIVVPDTLVGKTSIKLRDVTWRQIFDTILSPAGYTYTEEGNIIKIVSRDSLQQEPVTTEVFILNNAKAADIKPTVDGLVDAASGGKILIDARSNALVITTQPSRITRVRAIIEKLDKATDQVMIESKFVEVTDRDIRNIGVNWAGLSGVNLGARNLTSNFQRSRGQDFSGTNSGDKIDQTINRTGNGTSNSTGRDTLNKTDVITQDGNTVNYSVIPSGSGTGSFGTGTFNLPSGSVTNITPSVAANVGPSGFTPASGTSPASFTAPVAVTNTLTNSTQNTVTNNTAASTTASNDVTNTVNNTVSNLLSLTNNGGTSRLASAVFTASDFNVIVSALTTNNNTKVVSNPTIVTLNNTEGFINIGQEFPVPSYTYNSERGTFEVSGFTYKPIGVILKVTPQVNAQGNIRLTLEPEVSQQNGTTTFGGAGGAAIPIIATRKVKTQVSLKDGNTVGIGGLINYQKDHGGTKVPVLGSIPVVGRLFSSKSVNDTTSNLLIFITAKTVSAEGGTAEQVFQSSALDATGERGDSKK